MSHCKLDAILAAADDFEKEWRDGQVPSIRAVIALSASRDQSWFEQHAGELLASLIKIDMEYRWKGLQKPVDAAAESSPSASTIIDAPNGPLLEKYLQEFSDIPLGGDSLLQLITHEFLVRYRWGDRPGIAEYLQRFEERRSHVEDALNDQLKILSIESSIKHLFETPETVKEAETLDTDGETAANDDTVIGAVPRSLHDVLAEIQPFCELSQDVHDAVVAVAQDRTFAAGEVILRQGEVSDCLLIILDGVAEVSIVDDGEVHRIARVGRHTVIGEIGLVTREVRSANISALTSLRAAMLSKEDFESLSGRFPRLSIAMSELIAERVGTLTIDVLCGKTFNHHLVKQRLGRGSMGIVYKAINTETGEDVALKMLRHDLTFNRQATSRFVQEAEIVQSLRHENIVRVYEQFSAYQTNFISMEFCDGPTLAEFIKAHGPLPDDLTRAILGQLASALMCAHATGVAHRDLKPANVMMRRDGVVKLTDFGLARCAELQGTSLTAQGQVLGTPRYMAPEQLGGDRGDERVDLYALGCVAYEMVTGKPLFPARRFADLMRQRFRWSLPAKDEIRTDLDEGIYRLLTECLTDWPEDRVFRLGGIVDWAKPIDPALLEFPTDDDSRRQRDPPSTIVSND